MTGLHGLPSWIAIAMHFSLQLMFHWQWNPSHITSPRTCWHCNLRTDKQTNFLRTANSAQLLYSSLSFCCCLMVRWLHLVESSLVATWFLGGEFVGGEVMTNGFIKVLWCLSTSEAGMQGTLKEHFNNIVSWQSSKASHLFSARQYSLSAGIFCRLQVAGWNPIITEKPLALKRNIQVVDLPWLLHNTVYNPVSVKRRLAQSALQTASTLSLHFTPVLQSTVCILPSVCILPPVCSLQSAACVLHWPVYNRSVRWLPPKCQTGRSNGRRV